MASTFTRHRALQRRAAVARLLGNSGIIRHRAQEIKRHQSHTPPQPGLVEALSAAWRLPLASWERLVGEARSAQRRPGPFPFPAAPHVSRP